MSLLHLLEPEETIGNLWHRLVGSVSSVSYFPDAAVRFEEIAGPLRVFFRGVGGEAGAELKPAHPELSHHRLSRRLRLGVRCERIARARYNPERFSLPDTIEVYPERSLNQDLYFWLAAWTAIASQAPPVAADDPVAQDYGRIEHAIYATREVLRWFPGLAKPYERLCQETLRLRPDRSLPPLEAAVEGLIRELLSRSPPALDAGRSNIGLWQRPGATAAQQNYKTYLPVPLWGEIDEAAFGATSDRGDEEPGSGGRAAHDSKRRRARRRASGQMNRKGGFFVHRFEKILTWTEFMNLHRDVEDDDEEAARKAADDHDEIGVGTLEKKASTRLAIDLDLAPADVDAERISDRHTYPEWDFRRQCYLPGHVRVLERRGEVAEGEREWQPSPAAARRIRAVRRQFEALRPRRELLSRQLDGHELDIEAVIRSAADIHALGEGSDRIYRQARDQARDLAVAVLMDVSRSTESYVDGRPVIEIEREALVAFAEGLNACGDPAAIFTLSSLRRDRVFMAKLKDFDEAAGPLLRQRIAAVKPGFYTRLGAAIRHGAGALSNRPARKRLMLVLTDGKPNDIDYYEGRFGIEDTRKAIQEARRSGQTVFGITVDSRAQSYFPLMFGTGGYAILSNPNRLVATLPVLYRHLVS